MNLLINPTTVRFSCKRYIIKLVKQGSKPQILPEIFQKSVKKAKKQLKKRKKTCSKSKHQFTYN